LIGDATGALLAGGKGTRLGGVRKALLVKDGRALLAHTLELYARLFPHALVIANEAGVYDRFGAPVASDPIADRGAPGGLFAALSASTTPWLFLAACDMPALDARVIEALGSRRAGVQAVVATIEGRPEPLHAFWAAAARPTLERLLREGEPSFRDLLAEVPHARVPIEDLERDAPGALASFANVNTPDDLAPFGLALPNSGERL
jgi:molybdenum cofactor guanylyltransferase